MLSAEQIVFLEKYLGVKVPGDIGDVAQGDFESQWKNARGSWDNAIDVVNGQITKLVAELKSSDDPDLLKIADFGLNALTGNHKVRIMAAIQEINAAGEKTDAKVLDSAVGLIATFDDHLASDIRIKVVDDNPFGIHMSIASTMRAALNDLSRALKSAA